MTTRRPGVLGAALLVLAGAAGPVAIGESALAAEVALAAAQGWIMSGTGQPDPTVGPYLDDVLGRYLQPAAPLFAGQPTLPGFDFAGLSTPEQFCPFVCIPGAAPLSFGQSLDQGVADLNGAILPQLNAGDPVAAFGYSQSATIATIEMNTLIAKAGTVGFPSADQLADLHVVLIGDPNNPIGGILDRLQFPAGIEKFSLTPAPQHLPFVNIPLSLAPTPTDPAPTDIYTGEYDGWANFPQDPTNLLADLNALIGIATVHPYYPAYTPAQLADTIDVGTIGQTDFFMIPQNLPILQFMFNGGTAGQFFGDFFSPWARLVIDWGYGNAGDPAVDGLHPIPAGTFIEGSPYQQDFGVAGGPWAATPFGGLYDGTALMGLVEKMDPLQMLAGVQNALTQSLIGPWVDVAAAGGPLSESARDTVDDITAALRAITGYDLVNGLDQLLLGEAADLGIQQLVDTVFTGPLIPGQPILGLVGAGFDVVNFFGA